MNGAILLLAALAIFALGYLFYSRFTEKLIGVDATRPTPANAQRDDVDYVPAHPMVLFGHHFAAIAGAGPIVGPVLAVQFGWACVALWIVLGCVFIGAVHDMITLFLSVRHRGESIGSVIGDLLGKTGKILFLLFSWSALILVVAVFSSQVVDTFMLDPAIASASLLFIVEAIVFGLCVYRFKVPVGIASLVAVPVMFAFVWVGSLIPIDLVAMFGISKATAQMVWCAVLLVYCYFASTCPVWILLQPRDYLNAYLLYVMMALGILGVLVAQPVLHVDAFAGFNAEGLGGVAPLFPILFVTVACGACSGFHSLVASGTTSKQTANEKHIRPVAYGGMLLEGLLALIGVIGVAGFYASQGAYLEAIAGPEKISPVAMFANSTASFCVKLGIPIGIAKNFMLLALSAFLMTSVDAGTRLARFSWQELMPKNAKPLRNVHFGTLLVCVLAGVFLFGSETVRNSLWTLFASANQLLATLTLTTMTIWLLKNRKPCWMTAIPACFMMAVSSWALCLKIRSGFAVGNYLTGGTALFLLILGAVVVSLAIKEVSRCFRSAVRS